MRRLSLIFIAVLITNIAMAGGIITNANQSVQYVRMQARDATLGIDATYFNPAGISLLPNDGFYLSLNNQTLGQTRTITTDYPELNNESYQGNISAPFFPGVYLAYKKGKFAVSAGFNPIGGGGGGTYNKGLPSFEYQIADLVTYLGLGGLDINGYSMDAYFEGSSVFFGYQLNGSYKINDYISVGLGLRYVSAKEKYKGHLKDIMLNMGGTYVPATIVFSGIASDAADGAEMATGAATNINNAIGAGVIGANDPLADPTAIGTLTALGLYQDGMTNAQAAGTFSAVATELEGTAATAGATALILQDQEVDYEKTATGFTPIISVNIKPCDKFNIALKYEFQTSLEFTNKTKSDFTVGFNPETGAPITMFPDGAKSNLDIPAQLVVGLTYNPSKELLLTTGFHYYFDKQADWDGREKELDANSWEFAFGAEYAIGEKWLVSLGYLRTQSGVSESYQTDLSFSLPSNSIGGGLAYNINHMFQINLGGQYTSYVEGEKNFVHDIAGQGLPLPVKETYVKPIWIAAIGLDINFGAKK